MTQHDAQCVGMERDTCALCDGDTETAFVSPSRMRIKVRPALRNAGLSPGYGRVLGCIAFGDTLLQPLHDLSLNVAYPTWAKLNPFGKLAHGFEASDVLG